MFQFSATYNVSDGNLSSTGVGGTASNGGTKSVISGILQVGSTGASTATVTITMGSASFTLPELDLSDDANQVPFVLPILDPFDALSPTFSSVEIVEVIHFVNLDDDIAFSSAQASVCNLHPYCLPRWGPA